MRQLRLEALQRIQGSIQAARRAVGRGVVPVNDRDLCAAFAQRIREWRQIVVKRAGRCSGDQDDALHDEQFRSRAAYPVEAMQAIQVPHASVFAWADSSSLLKIGCNRWKRSSPGRMVPTVVERSFAWQVKRHFSGV